MTEIRPAKACEVDMEPTAQAPNHKPVTARTTTAPLAVLTHSTSPGKRKLLSL